MTPENLADRVRNLEAELARERRSRRNGRYLLALAMSSVVLIAASEPLKTLRAHRMEVGERAAPRIVLGEGTDGPSVVLRDEAGNVATLTARGINFTEPPPVEAPTLNEPGLAETQEKPTARLFLYVHATSVEVSCADYDFRERTAVVGGAAVVEVPEGAKCLGNVRGGPMIGRFPIQAGYDYRCSTEPSPGCRVVVRGKED